MCETATTIAPSKDGLPGILESTDGPGDARYTTEYLKSVLVTGGVGFVGSHVTEALLREGTKVIVYDIFNSETTVSAEKQNNANILHETAQENAHKGASITIINGDIRDRTKLKQIIKDYEITACVHAAGMVDDRRSVIFPEEYIEVNVRGTCILLDTLGQCGVKMVVQCSTRSVYGQVDDNETSLTEKADRRPVNPYGATKVAADAFAHTWSHVHKMNVSLVRISSCYGPRGRPDMIPRILIESIINDKPVKKFGDGTATRTWVYISDIVSAFMCALKNPQGGFAEFNTGAPNSTTLNDAIALAEKVVGKKAIIQNMPVPKGDAHNVGRPCFDHLKETLGWTPKVDVEEGLRLTYLDYMRQLKAKKEVDTGIGNSKLDEEKEEKKDDLPERTLGPRMMSLMY
mmetsp:Transcript_10641/g.18703  ORF Transcript_10641/g.18703 Transcript_10641/m.18703 type:complete len:403 (-) Transcript_10641:192-1400(-)